MHSIDKSVPVLTPEKPKRAEQTKGRNEFFRNRKIILQRGGLEKVSQVKFSHDPSRLNDFVSRVKNDFGLALGLSSSDAPGVHGRFLQYERIWLWGLLGSFKVIGRRERVNLER